MKPNEIHPCGSYHAGHCVHWIQAKKSFETQPTFQVAVVIHSDGRVELEGDGISLVMWNHDPEGLRETWHYRGRSWPGQRGLRRPRFHLLTPFGFAGSHFSLVAFEERTICHAGARKVAGESPEDFVTRAVRDDGGFVLPPGLFQQPGDER